MTTEILSPGLVDDAGDSTPRRRSRQLKHYNIRRTASDDSLVDISIFSVKERSATSLNGLVRTTLQAESFTSFEAIQTSQTTKIRISEIKFKLEEQRPLGNLDSLKASMGELGLLQPIEITSDHQLVFGFHRLQAAIQLGWTEIDARIVSYDNLEIELSKIDENLVRNEGSELDRDVWITRQKRIYEMLHPETRRGAKNQYSKKVLSETIAFSKNIAAKIGKSNRSIQNSIKIGQELEQYKDKLTGKPIEKNQKELLRLAKQEPEKREQLINLISENKVTHLYEAQKLVRAEKLRSYAISTGPENIRIDEGDIRKFPEKYPEIVKENSIDLILTDPPYDKDSIPLWRDLGLFARRVLKEGGFLITYSGQEYLNQYFKALDESGLEYVWECSLLHSSVQPYQHYSRFTNGWKPILIYSKEGGCNHQALDDVLHGEIGDKLAHPWAQEKSVAYTLIEKFTNPGDTVLDPMVGSGSFLVPCLKLKRNGIGVDINPECVEIARGTLNESKEIIGTVP